MSETATAFTVLSVYGAQLVGWPVARSIAARLLRRTSCGPAAENQPPTASFEPSLLSPSPYVAPPTIGWNEVGAPAPDELSAATESREVAPTAWKKPAA